MKRPPPKYFLTGVASAVLCAFVACGPAPEDRSEAHERPAGGATDDDERSDVVLLFGIPARSDPRQTYEGSQPLLDYLDEHTPYAVESRVGRSVELVEVEAGVQDLVTYLEERLADIAPLGAMSYCIADARYGALPLVKPLSPQGEPLEHSVFLAPSVSGLAALTDLAGKRLALGPTHSTLGSLLPRHELAEANVSPEMIHFDDDTAVIEAVARGDADAGAVASWAWDAESAHDEALEVFHVSRSIPSRPLVVREDLPVAVREALIDAFSSASAEPASVREAWDPAYRYGFTRGERSDYEPVRAMMDARRAACSAGCHE